MLAAHIEVHRTELREDRCSEVGSIGRCLVDQPTSHG